MNPRNRSPFNLLEILIITAVMAILVALALPRASGATFVPFSADAPVAEAAPTSPPPPPPASLIDNAKAVGRYIGHWFKDNTNFWGEQTVLAGVNGLYSRGKPSGDQGDSKDTFGAALDVRFPLDANGQVAIGFFAAYFNHSFYEGSISTTLGTTWNIPVINQPVYTFIEGGPALNLANPNEVLAQTFAGAVWKHDIVKPVLNADGTVKSSAWTLFVNAAYGKITGWDGDIFLLGAELGHKF